MSSSSDAAAWCPMVEDALYHPVGPVPPTSMGALDLGFLGYNFAAPEIEQPLDFYSFDSESQSSNLFPSFAPLSSTRPKSRVSLACIPCRSKHAKCDAAVPSCSQCRASGRDCSYVESRRGRGKDARPERDGPETERPRKRRNQHSEPGSDGATPISTINSNADLEWASSTLISKTESDRSTELLDLYYGSFHDAHPFVLPRHYLNQRLETDKTSLLQLLPVLEFVGSLFLLGAAGEPPRRRAQSAVLPENLPETGFTVQALLIFAISIHSCSEFAHAREILDRAIRIAIRIGMQHNSFSIENGDQSTVLEESWRRTWWYLFITDATFAGIRHCTSFLLYGIQADVDLPCEEASYRSGVSAIQYTSNSRLKSMLLGYPVAPHSR